MPYRVPILGTDDKIPDRFLPDSLPGGGGAGGPITADQITDSTAVGRTLLTAADSATARTALGAGTGSGNVYRMPDWDGVGAHPLRPTTLPAGTRVDWPQPFAPLITAGYALPGDRWEVIDL